MLLDSSTTHRTRSEREGCVQNWQGSTSVRLLQTEHLRMVRLTSRMDSANSVASAESIFNTKNAKRCADLVPMPGSFLNCSTSRLTGSAISMVKTNREFSILRSSFQADPTWLHRLSACPR